MTSRTHDLAAITVLGVIVLAQPLRTVSLSTALLVVLANQIGGIVPDIDQPTAPFWRNLPIGGLFGKITGKLLGGHRFLSHSLLGIVLFGFLAKLLLSATHSLMPHADNSLILWAFVIGMLSHLVMDSFTREGVPWLLPIPIKFGFPPIRKLRVVTGKKFESLVIFPGLLVIDFVVCISNYHQILSILHRHIV
jgi:inner membrane protein